jgi:hypothetical protein
MLESESNLRSIALHYGCSPSTFVKVSKMVDDEKYLQKNRYTGTSLKEAILTQDWNARYKAVKALTDNNEDARALTKLIKEAINEYGISVFEIFFDKLYIKNSI